MNWEKIDRGMAKKGYVYSIDRRYTIPDLKGKPIGNVSYWGKKAIEGNSLDSYTPRDEEEKKTLDLYKKLTHYGSKTFEDVLSKYSKNKHGAGNIDLTQRPVYKNEDGSISTVDSIGISEDGKEIVIPTIIRDKNGQAKRLTAEEAIAHYHNTGEYLGKFNTKEKADEYAKYLHKDQELYYNGKQNMTSAKENTEDKKDGFWSWLGKQAMSGITQFDKGLVSTLDFILPTEFLGKYDYISKLNDYYSNLNNHYGTEAQKSSESRGKGWKTAGDILSATVAAAPNAILAFATSGASLGATGASTMASGASNAGTVVSALKNTVNTMAKNPLYWSSLIQTLGNDYEEAKERGANDFVAASTAILTSALNAGIEVGGGIEELPKRLKKGGASGIYDFVKSSFEEGGEEVLQSITTNAMAGLMYDHDAPILSFTDDNAVINPPKLAKEFGMGVAVGGALGGVLGGVQTAAVKGLNAHQYEKTGKFFKDSEVVQDIINTGLESPADSVSYKLAEKAQKKLKESGKLSNYEIGKLYYANVEQIELEELNKKEESLNENIQDSKSVEQISASSSVQPTNTQAEAKPDVLYTITNKAKKRLENIAGVKGEVTINPDRISAVNGEFLSNQDALLGRDFVHGYAESFVEALEKSGSEAFNHLKSQSDNVVEDILNAAVFGTVPQNADKTARTALHSFGKDLRAAVSEIGQTLYSAKVKSVQEIPMMSSQIAALRSGNLEQLLSIADGQAELEGYYAMNQAGNTVKYKGVPVVQGENNTVYAFGENASQLADITGVSPISVSFGGHTIPALRVQMSTPAQQTPVQPKPMQEVTGTQTQSRQSAESRELSETPDIELYAPENAGKDVLKIEESLVYEGAMDNVRKEIVETALDLEEDLAGTDKSVLSIYKQVAFVTKKSMQALVRGAGNSSAYWNLLSENFRSMKKNSSVNRENIISAYAKAYTEALKKNSPERYASGMTGANDTDLSSKLTDCIIRATIPTDVKSSEIFSDISSDVRNISEEAIFSLTQTRNSIYKEVQDSTENASDTEAVNEVKETPMKQKKTPVKKEESVENKETSVEKEEPVKHGETNAADNESETVTSINPENMPVTDENTPVAEEKTEYKHLYNEETVSEDFINSVNPEIESAILNIRNGNIEAVPDIVEVTELTEETIEKISDFVGFDVSGYSCKIEKDALQHIENRHGINGSHDHTLSDPKDTARMGYVVNNSDSVDWIREKDGAVKTSKKYRDKNNKPAKLVMIQKKIDGTYCVSDVVPDSKNKTIWVTSARIQKKHQDLDDNNVSPKTTPENALNASDTIIAEETQNVNTLEEIPTPTLTERSEPKEGQSNDFQKAKKTDKKPETKPIEDNGMDSDETSAGAENEAKEKPDLKVGDVIELDGKRWRMTKDGFNMSFENLDGNDKEQAFSHVGGMESFKEAHDYKLVDEAKEKEKPSGSDDEKGLQRKTKNDTMSKTAKKATSENAESEQNNRTPSVYDVAYFDDLSASIRKGESVSLKDMKTAVDAMLMNHGEAIKAELSQLKNAELKKRISIYDRGSITKKADMVDSIYTDMLSSLYYAISGKETITYIYDGTGFEAQQSKMLFDLSRELTEETFSKRLEENAEKYKKQLAEREEKIAKVKNPRTLEDYAYKKRYFGLSDEETIQYEKLYAEERRKARENKKADKTAKDTGEADSFFANADNYTIEKTTHTKTGEDVWVVRPVSRLETEQWKRLNEQMKALGGSYWSGNQGWNFKKDPIDVLTSAEEAEIETAKGSTNVEKLRAVAEGMQKAIDDKFRDRLTNTAKRAREAAAAEAEGERLKRLQDTINNIAYALENGEDTLLDKIDSKAQVETLMNMLSTGRINRISETMPNISYAEHLREQDKPYSNEDVRYVEYPLTKLHENTVKEYIRAAEGKNGYKQITERLKKALKSAKNGYVSVNSQLYNDINKIVQNLSPFRADFWNDGVLKRKRLARMGIENVVELRAYLRDFIEFLPERNLEAEKQRAIKKKERELVNSRIDGFFPTPKAIVGKMIDEADIQPGEKVLEPSAGKGNIADEIREKYPDNALDVVEWNASLNELLSEKGHNVVGENFLHHTEKYDKIIMNPPFENGQDIDHIRHAYSLLNDGGRVVCIMSEGPFYRSDKKSTEFREWLDSLGGVSEKLPDGAFKNSERSTGVNTRLVVIDKSYTKNNPDESPRVLSTEEMKELREKQIRGESLTLFELRSIQKTLYGNRTREREITSQTYKSAQKRLKKDVDNFLGIKYSIAKTDTDDLFDVPVEVLEKFSSQIDGWLNRTLPSSTLLRLGNTPEVLKQLGADDLPIVMSQDVLAKITGEKHSISLDEIKNLPRTIADPVMIFKSETVANSFVIFTELEDKNGNEVVVAMHLNRAEGFNKVNRIASVYGKYNIVNFIKKQIAVGNLKYIEKNKSSEWLRSRGLQLPKLNTIPNFDNSILQKEDIVNRYVMQNSENNAKYSTESEEFGNEQTGKDLLSGNGRRKRHASAGKQAKRIRRYERSIKGETRQIRRETAKRLRSKGLTKREVYDNHSVEYILPEGYTDSMKEIVKDGEKHGKKVRFILGYAVEKLDTKRKHKVDAMINGDDIIIRYDGVFAPEQLYIHERVHDEWDTDRMQQAKSIILDRLSPADKKEILNSDRYKRYMDIYRGNKKAVLEEYVADVFGGMNSRADMNMDVVTDYWHGEDIESVYSPGTYAKEMDSGTNAKLVNGAGITEDPVIRGNKPKYALSMEQDEQEVSEERKAEIIDDYKRNKLPPEAKKKINNWLDAAKEAAHAIGRTFPEIAERGEKGTFFAEFRKEMIKWSNLRPLADNKAVYNIQQITRGLSPQEFDTFSKLVYFLDLQEEAKIQMERGEQQIRLSGGVSAAEVEAILKDLEQQKTGKVAKALELRTRIWNEMKDKYIRANHNIGFEVADRFTRQSYYHHQVLDKDEKGRGWLKQRHGSELDTNTDYLSVEHKVMRQMLYDTYVAETQGLIKDKYDIRDELNEEAMENNMDKLDERIHYDASGEIQQRLTWYNQRIKRLYGRLFALADEGKLPNPGNVFGEAVSALERHSIDAREMKRYLGALGRLDTQGNVDDTLVDACTAAKGILRYTIAKNNYVKDVLGDEYQDWVSLAESKEGYSVYYPEGGTYFYNEKIITEDDMERIADQLVLTLAEDESLTGQSGVKELFEAYASTIRKSNTISEPMVLPDEIIKTMESVMGKAARERKDNPFEKVSREVIGIWKKWVTVGNPARTFGFGLRNIIGDADAVIAGNIKVMSKLPQAFVELKSAMRDNIYSEAFAEWVDRGGYTSLLLANEMDAKTQEKLFKHLQAEVDAGKSWKTILKSLSKPPGVYFDAIEGIHNFRESLLRYSAYLYNRERIIKNNGKIKDYEMSNKYIVDGLSNPLDKAYQMSKDMLGAYDEVSQMGRYIRRYLVPFYSFTETLFRRYFRLFENAVKINGSVPDKVLAVAKRLLAANLMALLYALFNRLLQREADDKLPEYIRNQPHITLGSFGGKAYALTGVGSWSTLLGWFGLDDYKWESPSEPFWAMFGNAVNMIGPLRGAAEAIFGRTVFPDVANPRPVYNKAEHLAKSVGLGTPYRIFTGKSTKPIGDVLSSLIVNSYDVQKAAYDEVRSKVRGDSGGSYESTDPTAKKKSNALYEFRLAIQRGNARVAKNQIEEYYKSGGTAKGLVKSISNLAPNHGYKSKPKEWIKLTNSWTPEEKDKLMVAQEYYDRVLAIPPNLANMILKSKSEDAAKTAIDNYIDSKCK